MDDGVGFLTWVVGTFAFRILVLSIIDCIEKRQRRHEEDATVRAAVAAAGAQSPRLSIALTILDYVSLPRQHQGGAVAGGGSTPAAERPECVFCLGELEDDEEWVVLKTCQHEFHRKCMAKWLEQKKSRCPTCRAAVWPKTPALADMV